MTLTLYAHFCHFLPLFVNDFQDFKVSKFQSNHSFPGCWFGKTSLQSNDRSLSQNFRKLNLFPNISEQPV